MSWSASWSEGVRADHIDEDFHADKAVCSPPDRTGWDDHVTEQFETAWMAAKGILEKGVVGGAGKVFGVTLSGHANPDHEPTEGWANDMISMSISQRTPAA